MDKEENLNWDELYERQGQNNMKGPINTQHNLSHNITWHIL